MATTIATAKPSFHALTGAQPIGHTQIASMSEYAGTITSVTRINKWYWSVTTRDARDAFSNPKLGASATIWFDHTDGPGRYVVDYWDHSTSVEAGRSSSLKAAVGIACDVTARRWADSQ